jgi:hypothetical protein
MPSALEGHRALAEVLFCELHSIHKHGHPQLTAAHAAAAAGAAEAARQDAPYHESGLYDMTWTTHCIGCAFFNGLCNVPLQSPLSCVALIASQ